MIQRGSETGMEISLSEDFRKGKYVMNANCILPTIHCLNIWKVFKTMSYFI